MLLLTLDLELVKLWNGVCNPLGNKKLQQKLGKTFQSFSEALYFVVCAVSCVYLLFCMYVLPFLPFLVISVANSRKILQIFQVRVSITESMRHYSIPSLLSNQMRWKSFYQWNVHFQYPFNRYQEGHFRLKLNLEVSFGPFRQFYNV